MKKVPPGVLWLGVFLLVVGLYLPALDGEFVFDDRKLVVENTELWEGWGFDLRVFSARSSDSVRTNFRPVRFASYKIDALLTAWTGKHDAEGMPRPFFFHLQNLILHGLNTLLVGWIALFLMPRQGGLLPPVLVALAFGLHPVHSECVAYISGAVTCSFCSSTCSVCCSSCHVARRTAGDSGSLSPLSISSPSPPRRWQ